MRATWRGLPWTLEEEQLQSPLLTRGSRFEVPHRCQSPASKRNWQA